MRSKVSVTNVRLARFISPWLINLNIHLRLSSDSSSIPCRLNLMKRKKKLLPETSFDDLLTRHTWLSFLGEKAYDFGPNFCS